MPDCRCTNKQSCLVRNSSTWKWKCFTCTLTKQTINYPNPNSWKCSRATITWEHGSQFSPAQYYCWLIAHCSFKIPAQDILEIYTPQLPSKRIRAEKRCWKCSRPECDDIKTKRYCKNRYDDCNREYCDQRDSRWLTRPCQNNIDSTDGGRDGRMGTTHVYKLR